MPRKKKYDFIGTKRSIEKKKRLIEALQKTGCNISKSCEIVGISRTEFYRMKKEDPEFEKAVENVYEALIDFAESALLKQIRDGNTTAIIFFLKTKGRHRGYIEKHDFDLGSVEIVIEGVNAGKKENTDKN